MCRNGFILFVPFLWNRFLPQNFFLIRSRNQCIKKTIFVKMKTITIIILRIESYVGDKQVLFFSKNEVKRYACSGLYLNVEMCKRKIAFVEMKKKKNAELCKYFELVFYFYTRDWNSCNFAMLFFLIWWKQKKTYFKIHVIE